MEEANSGKISLKLLVDRNANRVIFGEAGKDFVDFLFQFLSLPVGTVVKLLSENKMVGSLGKIYESIENMRANYMEPNLNKDHVLNPKVYSSVADTPLLLGNKGDADQLTDGKVFYECGSCHSYFASDLQTDCPSCRRNMNCQMTYVMHANFMEPGVNKEHVLNPKVSSSSLANTPFMLYQCSSNYNSSCRSYVSTDMKAVCPSRRRCISTKMTYVHGPGKEAAKVEKGSGYVKGLVTYMVMDNLEVKPLSTISSITLLSTFKVKDLSALETLEVCIGKKEALEMLKASFVTDRVLTSLFLGDPKA